MLKELTKELGLFIKRWPILLAAITVAIVFISIMFQQLLQRGYERAQREQQDTNTILIYAIEDSVTRSIQAISSSLSSLAPQVPTLSQGSIALVKEQMLRSIPQLRSIAIAPLSEASLCLNNANSFGFSEILILPPQDGRQWGLNPNISGLQYWPICAPFYDEAQLKGFIVGSINPNYYSNLLNATEYGRREAKLFRYSGEDMLGGQQSMPSWVKQALRYKSWGVNRFQQGTSSAYVENFRATSQTPFVVTFRSYESIDLANWFSDAHILRWSFVLLMLGIVLIIILFMILKHKQERERGSNRLLSEAIRNTASAIFITDPDGKINWVNQAFTHLTGYDLEEVRNKTPRILNSGIHKKSYFDALWRAILAGKTWRGELVNRDKLGRLITVNQMITPIKSSAGEIEHFIAVHEDISARKKAEEKALFFSNHDGLTGLMNRRYFEEKLNESLHSDRQGLIGLIFIDLDLFKEINDTLGHEAGDVLLKRTAQQLQDILPDDAVLARLGGDEFALFVYPLLDHDVMMQLANSIVNALAAPFDYRGSKFSVTCSVGVAINDIKEVDSSTLLRQADMAMYRAKHEGRNRHRAFDLSMDEIMKYRVSLHQELEEAILTGNGLSVHFQPQIAAISSQFIGAEVLFRWVRNNGENLSPADFIPILEETGQIVSLGLWIIQATCKQVHDWRLQGFDPGKISINISSVQLSSSMVTEDLIKVMKQYDIPSTSISVEFTETALMVSSKMLSQNLALLGEENIDIAIDDFGTGYCSLTYLKRLNAHYLKIDQSFVAGIGISETDESIVLASIAMAKGLNMKVIAEGVESEGQVEFLRKHQCDILQGYYFGKPMTAEAYQVYISQTHLI